MTKVTTVGVDLAKSVFTIHGVDAAGRTVLRKTVRREKLLELIAALPPCLIGMEACSGAHEWARRFERHGHRVGIMMARFVAAYRKSSKNDGNDAEAICEAVARPNMRFVPVKSVEQQAILSVHRVRQGFIEQRTATINRMRGLLAEFGVVLPQRADQVRRAAIVVAEALPVLAAAPPGRARSRPADRVGDHRQHGQRSRVRERTPVCRLARLGAAPIFDRRQDAPGPHHQAWRWVLAHAADARCACRTAECCAKNGSAVTLGAGVARPTWVSPRHYRRSGQERPHHLGAAGPGSRVRVGRLAIQQLFTIWDPSTASAMRER